MSEGKKNNYPLKLAKPTKESIEESIRENNQELFIIKELRDALKKYLLIDDYTDYSIEDALPTFCLILGRLEMSIARREQMLIEEGIELSRLNGRREQIGERTI